MMIKQRILTGWNLPRILYLLAGTMILIQSAAEQQWMGVVFGGYFAMMGIFAFGCAAGNCYDNRCNETVISNNKSKIEEVEFEEIKQSNGNT